MPAETVSRASGDTSARLARPGGLRANLELFLISFAILYFELACIRWLGSTVIFLTFFTNIVLLASFLGVSVGCLAAGRRWSWISTLVPLLLLTTASACGSLWAYQSFQQVLVDVGSQQSPQLIYFGTDDRIKDPTKWVVPIEVLAAYFFVLVSLLFVGLGQEMGRRFTAINNRLVAYSADIFGSLAGIAAFGLASFLGAPGWTWFLVPLVVGASLVPRRRVIHALLALATLAVAALADWPADMLGVPTEVIWSPYYQVRFKPRYLSIDVNSLGHQSMVPLAKGGPAYVLSHWLNRDSGGKPFGEMLVIGAGSGNDVTAALANGVGHIDAVEIDPVIQALGRAHHPDRPFDDPRVTVYLDDGRDFIRKTQSRYDIVTYALVDSLALHSSYTSVRLESFLFTEQAFRDVKARLKPGGVFAMYNFFRQGWVVGRLVKLAEKVFGTAPVVFSTPFQESISPDDIQRGYNTFLLVGNGESPVVESIRSKFASEKSYWITTITGEPGLTSYFSPKPPVNAEGQRKPNIKIAPVRVTPTEPDTLPTDDWPFLYLRRPMIPLVNLRGMAIVGVLSMVILAVFAPARWVRPNGSMFFLGAGFMLLETKSVVHMALLFGATWVVNAIVFFAILTMILISNLYVMAVRPRRLGLYYVLLLAALLLCSLIPMDEFLALPGVSKVVVSCSVVLLPVFFAGVIFATQFRSSARPDVDFGSNIAGVILGGLSENLSLIMGFNHLLWVAMGYYLLSALFWSKRPAES